MIPGFWQNKRVFLTGHTGFKGSWLCLLLSSLARVGEPRCRQSRSIRVTHDVLLRRGYLLHSLEFSAHAVRDERPAGVRKHPGGGVFLEQIRYANIIFDLDRASLLATVHGYLDDIGIAYCGRYGDWGYMWTDESFISGERAAELAWS